jgi:putative polyhydroxyalkanoate system protein
MGAPAGLPILPHPPRNTNRAGAILRRRRTRNPLPMAIITISRKHALSHKKAKDAADKIARDLKKRFELDYAWDGDQVHFERPGVSGRMLVAKDTIKLEAQLGFLLSALKPAIEKEIHLQFDKLVGPATKA